MEYSAKAAAILSDIGKSIIKMSKLISCQMCNLAWLSNGLCMEYTAIGDDIHSCNGREIVEMSI